MTLDQFMKSESLTLADVAKIVNRDVSVVSRYRTRNVSPPASVIAKLLKLSNDKISVADLLPKPAVNDQ